MPDKRTNRAMYEPVNTMRAALLCAGIGVVCGGMLGGCRSDKDYYNYRSISGNLTPELQGISERQVDVDRNLAVNQNADIRLMWSDLGRGLVHRQPQHPEPALDRLHLGAALLIDRLAVGDRIVIAST